MVQIDAKRIKTVRCSDLDCELPDHYHMTGNSFMPVVSAKLVVTALPVILCNVVAIFSQYSFFYAHLPKWGVAGAILFASALESIAVFLAYMAHQALLSNDASLKLRLGSYLVGGTIGLINYSHFAVNLHPTVEAVSVGILSAASAPLWGIYSRRVSRDALMVTGAIEGHAVRLGSARWTFHPVISFKVLRLAVWNNPSATPTEAIADWDETQNNISRGHANVKLCACNCGLTLRPGTNRNYIRGHKPKPEVSTNGHFDPVSELESVNGSHPKSGW